MELEGSISVFPLPEVLQFLAQGRMSGTLALSRGENTIHLEIREGKIVNSSTLERAHKLGEMLVHRNVIPRRVLDEALATQRQTDQGRLLGELLIEQGKVTREQLRSAVRLQMEEEIWELFGWREGNFKFENGRMSLDRPAAVEIEIEPLLLEGNRRMDEWQVITKNITEDEDVFTVVPPHGSSEKLFQVKDREWIVLSLINGSFNVGSIIARAGYGTFETYRILNRLLMAGLIQKLQRKPVARPGGVQKDQAVASGNGSSNGQRNEATGSGIKNLLSRKKASSETLVVEAPRQRISTDAATPVGLLVTYVNEVLSTLLASSEFSAGEGDDNLAESLWQPLVNICPKADLVRVRGNRFDASVFERYSSMGASDKMQSCYEDSMEALSRLLNRLHKAASQRMGERNANRVFRTVSEILSPTALSAFDADFDLSQFVTKSVG